MFKRKPPNILNKHFLGIPGDGMSFNSNLKTVLIARNISMFGRRNNMKKISEKTAMKVTLISCLFLAVITVIVMLLVF